MQYEERVREVWSRPSVGVGEGASRLREAVRYGTLASSSHNTQCWRFCIESEAVSIQPDFSRRCPVVDPDDHHLYVSLGCAAENIVQAATALGLSSSVETGPSREEGVRLAFAAMPAKRTDLFEAIPERQCTRTAYDGRPLTVQELRQLEAAGSGRGVQAVLITDRPTMETVLEYVVEGNTAQMQNPAFVAELVQWIRFNDAEAVALGDGLSSRSSGNPSLPRWLGRRLFPLVYRVGPENDKHARHVRSSSGLAIFVSDHDDRAHWVEAGRCYQRFALQATAMGVRNAFLNQPVEEPSLRLRFAKDLKLGADRPDLVVRFGRGPVMPPSLRRPFDAVMV